MITLNNVGVSFSGEDLFTDVSFMIDQGDRIGLVGKNGAGKTTLLSLITGEEEPTSGHISRAKETTTGYLKQDIDFVDGNTVYNEAAKAFEEVQRINGRLGVLRDQLAERKDTDSDEYMNILHESSELEERMNTLGGYSIEAEITRVLQGLGFREEDLEYPTETFSGGWRMRVELAKLLLQKPDVLLLDEPTNHLDIESIIWLEKWLKTFEGALILVSHDRKFLDNVTNRTIEITNGKIFDHRASYSEFVKIREERRQRQMQAKKDQEKEVKRMEGLIEKFRYKKTKASFAQSLIKKLDKMEEVEVDDVETAKMGFRFPPAPHSGKISLEAEQVGKSYDETTVLKDVDLLIERGDKVAFVGKNGEGKTTLARILSGDLDHNGSVKLGHKVSLGYYAQDQSDQLDEEKTVLATIEDAAPDEVRPKVRDLLGCFLFSGDDVQKRIKVLSGGERARVALCKLLLEPVNLLIMDEPTNHLDMVSKDILKNALKEFDGTLILVSHDRDFLQGLTEKTYEFRDKGVKEYLGDIQYFLEKREMEDLNDLNAKRKEKKKKGNGSGKQNHLNRKDLNKKLRAQQKEVKRIESRIEKTEEKVKDLEKRMVDPDNFQNGHSDKDIFQEHREEKEKLDTLMNDWEKAQEEMETLKAQWDETVEG